MVSFILISAAQWPSVLFLFNVGVCSTAQAIIDTLSQFIEKHVFDCVKHTAVATVAIANPERHVRKASHRGSMQQ